MSVVETQDSFVEITIIGLPKDDCAYEVLKKVADHLSITLKNPGANAGIAILRDSFVDAFVGSYAIKENGAGITIGLFKNVDGNLKPISLSLPGEIKLLKGSGIGPLVPPDGWRIVADTTVQAKYNLGVSPNWEVAAVEYFGI